ncbi:methyl-accepting chemotaxis protein [Sphingomonas cynarae]|uniref:Methyl-accepting chemotaxis protein n=1 Tax=Sphingomonas cynarae TaxID=930197 RepID=A0ABP7D2D3_9SPHN
MSHYTIKAKLLLCLSLFAVAFVVMLAMLQVGLVRNQAAFQTLLVDRIEPMRDLKIIADAYAVTIVDASHKARNGGMTWAEAERSVAAGRARIDTHWRNYTATSITGHEKRLMETARRTMAVADADLDRLQRILRQTDRAGLDTFVVDRLYPATDPVSAAIGDLVDEQLNIAGQVTSHAEEANRIAQIVSILIGVAVAVVWLFTFIVSRRSISQPIHHLAATMDALACNREDTTIPYQEQQDEIGRMARACEVFRAHAVERSLAEERDAATVRQVTGDLRLAIGAIANGDLTHKLVDAFPTEYEPVRHDFNAALTNLRDLIGSVSESATAIRTGSGEIAQASEDLARRTESNAASLEETTASIAQIDDRLKASAVAAGHTVDRADQAIATVGGGRAVADEAVQAMGRVSDSAKGIDSVIEGLDKIAFQTRVLAMNAAVEAGRAGDAGRGFAVVADLVSALAMRAEEEAKRARDQLTVTQTDIVTAVEAVTKVDGALANISGDVAQVHELLATMASDNQAQSAAITQISAAIGTMDQSTQQNAAMVEETSAAARNLAGEVGQLADQAGRFVIDPAATRRPAPRHSLSAFPPPPAATARPRPAVLSSPIGVSPMASTGIGDDWRHF